MYESPWLILVVLLVTVEETFSNLFNIQGLRLNRKDSHKLSSVFSLLYSELKL